MADINYKIVRTLGTLSTNENSGWSKEANIISWNGGPEKLDIRDWNPGHSKCAKGITLTEDEARQLGRIIADLFRR